MKLGTTVIVYGILIGTVVAKTQTLSGQTFWHIAVEASILVATVEHLETV